MNSKRLILPALLQALALAACEGGNDAGGAETAEPSEQSPATDASPAKGSSAADVAPAEGSSAADAPPAEDSSAAVEKAAAPATEEGTGGRPSPGKPTAPISIDYTVIGTPLVGQPVSVNLDVESAVTDRPVTLSYRINDASSLTFPEAQPQRVPLGAMSAAQPVNQQVSVVPQREGRAYLNVSAEVETGEGTLLKSIAIPIQVGATPGARQRNGEVLRDANGDPIVSLPADDR